MRTRSPDMPTQQGLTLLSSMLTSAWLKACSACCSEQRFSPSLPPQSCRRPWRLLTHSAGEATDADIRKEGSLPTIDDPADCPRGTPVPSIGYMFGNAGCITPASLVKSPLLPAYPGDMACRSTVPPLTQSGEQLTDAPSPNGTPFLPSPLVPSPLHAGRICHPSFRFALARNHKRIFVCGNGGSALYTARAPASGTGTYSISFPD